MWQSFRYLFPLLLVPDFLAGAQNCDLLAEDGITNTPCAQSIEMEASSLISN